MTLTPTLRPPRPKLAELHEHSTLAEIRFAQMNADESVSHFELLDSKFENRPDYQCWRGFYNMAVRHTEYRDEWLGEAVRYGTQALADNSEMIRWGAIGTIVRNLLADNADEFFQKHGETLLDIVERCVSLARHPNRWREAPAGCAYLDLMSRLAFSKLRNRDGQPYTIASAGVHLDNVEARVREIDDQWKPGDTVRLFAALKNERMVVPFDRITDIENQLAKCFYVSRVIVRNACKADASVPSHDAVIGRLLKRAMHLARSNQLTLRAGRIGAEKKVAEWTAKGGTPTGWFTLNARQDALNIELKALHAYACAQRDAGDDFGAARSNWILLAFAKSTLGQNASLQCRLREWLDKSIMEPLQQSCDQVGLTVPGRARKTRAPNSAETSEKHRGNNLETAQPFRPSYPEADGDSAGSAKDDAYRRRLLSDYANSTDWDVLKRHLGPPEGVDPHQLLRNAKNWWRQFCNGTVNNHPLPSVLQAAFRLCLKYNRIDDANWFLKCVSDGQGTQNGDEAHGWTISARELLDFARAVCHASAILPMGLDFDKHEFWRQRMLRACSVLRDELSPEQSLVLHEAVHGCCNALCARSPIADDLCRHFESPEGEVWDRSDRALKGSWKPPEPWQIGRFLEALSISGQGAPVAVSIASLRETGLSVCAVGPGGQCALDWIEGVNDKMCEKELADALVGCDRADLFLPKRCPSVVRVVKKVAEMVLRLAPNASWIALSVDTELASVPWNLLMPRLGCHSPVAVVPSLGWLGMLRKPRPVAPSFQISPREALVRPTFIQSEIDSIDALLAQIKKDEVMHDNSVFDVATILGHGCQSDDGDDAFQTVQIGAHKVSQSWWLKGAEKHDVLVVHGCLTGRVGQRLLRDLSGVPGMALLAGASLVVSPVIEIGSDAALVLQRHIMATPVSGTIAERYQRARKDCPSVGLYNLYGVPSRPLA